MIMVLAIILLGAIAVLWSQIQDLRRRVEMLELFRVGLTEPDTMAGPVEMLEAIPEPAPYSPPLPELEPEPIFISPWQVADENLAEAKPSLGFEDIFGRRLPIWAGGVTLAVAGFLIVKYSIGAGLLQPATRVILGMLFGTLLVGGGEAALRAQNTIRDVRIRQALSGAGIATWFGAILVAADLYHLISPMTAIAGMAIITAFAALLSLRFGAPCAVLGLLGGLAAPALVGSTAPNVPLLSLYLALTIGGLSAVARRQCWWWLGAAALTGGFGWGFLLILDGLIGLSQTLSVGLYTLALAAGLPLLLTGERATLVRLIAGIAGCTQMAALVALGHYALLDWGLLGLLSVAALWLSRREAMLAEIPAIAAGVAILLALGWPAPPAGTLALVLAGMVLIHALPAALRIWTPATRLIDAPIVAGCALAVAILPAFHFPHAAPLLRAAPALLGAAMAAGIAGWGWTDRARCAGKRFAILAVAAAASLAFADGFGLADWTVPGAVALLAFGLQLLGLASANRLVERAVQAFGIVALALLADAPFSDMLHWNGNLQAPDWAALARWAIPAAAAIGIACTAPGRVGRIAQASGALLFYSACAQVLPGPWLPLVPSLLLAGLAMTKKARLWPAAATAAVLALCWAVIPVAAWLLGGGYAALSAEPFYLPADNLWPTIRQLALPALAIGLTAMRLSMPQRARIATSAVATMLGLAAAHIAYRHMIVIDNRSDFIARGMMERTVWEMILAGFAITAWALRRPHMAILLGGASIVHFVWFTILLHNPLWVYQTIGVWLVPAYMTAFFLVWAADWLLPAMARPRNWAMMALIVLFAFSALRQIAHDPMPLRVGVGSWEDIARSVLAIGLAIGFLRYGIARAARDWRLVSLALMLVAAGKVFLFDASGLDGLLRIGAFAALGISLIGIGWLYSRYLPDESVRP